MLAISDVWALAAEHILSFSVGLLAGFVASNRYRIVKRNGRNGDAS